MSVDLYDGLAGTVSAPLPGEPPPSTARKAGDAERETLRAAGDGLPFHGTPGRPSYRKYHPSGRNRKESRGLRQVPGGGFLGSDRFTEEEHLDTLRSYNLTGFRDMNGLLRKGEEGFSPDQVESIRKQNSILTDLIEIQPPTTSETKLYRGMNAPRRPVFRLSPGDEFHDRGFLSTSSDPQVARSLAGNNERSVQFTILVPKGAQMADMNALRGINSSESEFILPPGSKFRVRRIINDDREEPDEDSGPVHYELELING